MPAHTVSSLKREGRLPLQNKGFPHYNAVAHPVKWQRHTRPVPNLQVGLVTLPATTISRSSILQTQSNNPLLKSIKERKTKKEQNQFRPEKKTAWFPGRVNSHTKKNGEDTKQRKLQVEKHLKRMMRFSFSKSGSNVQQKVHYINLFKASWTHNLPATESRKLQLVLWGSTKQISCLTQLNF